MEHLKMHTINKVDENVSKIAALFPNCVTEAKDENGEITHKIDFDMLKQELSHSLVEGREERYQFTWPDKKQAILTANAPINKTLRPCREESVNFDKTENLYIESKMKQAQCGQFVAFPNTDSNSFDYSKANAYPENIQSEAILDKMTEDFDRYKNPGTDGTELL